MTVLTEQELQDLLDVPSGWGVKFFLASSDDWNTDDWEVGDAMLLKAEIIVPIPTGKFRLP